MKKTIFLLILLTPFLGYSQKPIDLFKMVDGKATYEDVVTVDPSASKTELYNRAKIWVAKNYVSANDVIQVSDKEEGRIVGKGTFQFTMDGFVQRFILLDHTISIYTKDGKYKYTITDLMATVMGDPLIKVPIQNEYPKGLVKNVYSKLTIQTDAKISALVASLKKSMATPIDSF